MKPICLYRKLNPRIIRVVMIYLADHKGTITWSGLSSDLLSSQSQLACLLAKSSSFTLLTNHQSCACIQVSTASANCILYYINSVGKVFSGLLLGIRKPLPNSRQPSPTSSVLLQQCYLTKRSNYSRITRQLLDMIHTSFRASSIFSSPSISILNPRPILQHTYSVPVPEIHIFHSIPTGPPGSRAPLT